MVERRIPTRLNNFNELSKGGLPVGVPVGLVGTFKVGKSLLVTHFKYDISDYLKERNMPNNIVVFDMENTLAENFLTKWIPKLNKRFKRKILLESYRLDKRKLVETGEVELKTVYSTDEECDAKVIVINIGDIKNLQVIFGRKSDINISAPTEKSEGGQVTVVPAGWISNIWETPAAKWLERFNAGCLIIDSLTQAFTAAFGLSRQTYPGRATVNMSVLTQLHELVSENDIVCICTHHETKDPSNTKSPVDATGGAPVGHNFKEMYRIRGSSSTGFRDIMILRYADQPMKKSTKVRIMERGYYDVKEEKKKK